MKKTSVGISIVAAFGATVAFAAPDLPHKDGLLILPNTRVVQAAKPFVAKANPTAQAGARVFVDPVSGVAGAGEVTAQEAAELIDAQKMARRDRAKSVAGVNIRTSADGSITGARLVDLADDSDIMPYSVVRKTKTGELQFMCVQGEKSALSFMKTAAKTEKKHAH